MQIGSDQWRDILVQGTSKFGLSLMPRQIDQMTQHAIELLQWNRKINLTAITDPTMVAVKHCLDSIIPTAHIPSAGDLLDMGSGGGFPGIPLKILRPDQPMTLVDTSRKKINFIRHVIRQLKLKDIWALQIRVEDLRINPNYCKRFQTVVSRAFTDLQTILKVANPLLSDGGLIVTYQGPDQKARQDISKIVPDVNVSTIEYQLPFLGDQRILVVAKLSSNKT